MARLRLFIMYRYVMIHLQALLVVLTTHRTQYLGLLGACICTWSPSPPERNNGLFPVMTIPLLLIPCDFVRSFCALSPFSTAFPLREYSLSANHQSVHLVYGLWDMLCAKGAAILGFAWSNRNECNRTAYYLSAYLSA